MDVLESTLDRIRLVEGSLPTTTGDTLGSDDGEKIHAYITLTEERARIHADQVDRALESGNDPGPFLLDDCDQLPVAPGKFVAPTIGHC